MFKKVNDCNGQLLYGKKSRNSQRNEFIYINLQFFNVAIQWLNTIMFRFILYRLIIKRAYVIIGYMNILKTRNISGNNYKTWDFINIYMIIPSNESTLLYHAFPSIILTLLVAPKVD